MGNVRVTPRSLTDAYKRREGDFSPNLVGFQFTNGESLFTFGNFQITTNLDPRLAKDFMLGGEWSDYYSLNNLNLTQEDSEILLSNDINVRLNFNPKNIDRYVYFGSFYELTKVTIEQIIQKWKGSLYVNPSNNTNTVLNTILSFNYNSGQDISTFLIPTNAVSNKFELIIENESLVPITTVPGEIYDVNVSYLNYVIWNQNSNIKTPVIAFTGSSSSYPYLTIQTKGNPFPTLTASTFGQITYHMMPIENEINLLFQQLDDFEKVLLNNLTVPKYTSKFNTPMDVDGTIVFYEKSFTWPTTDGYNIDIDTFAYRTYVENVLNMAYSFDAYKTDLVSRRFVSETIQEYDTDGGGTEIYGRKVKKLLRIYGREFDEVKKYVDGISFANVVTYNKLDNTSDELIRIIAKNLGFDFFLTTTNNNFNLLEQLQTDDQPVFSGYSRNLSAKELETELWRRLIINAWWLYKSKGTRKVIEFFFKLFKIPECMVTLNEYVYLAKDRLDTYDVVNELSKIYDVSFGDIVLSDLPMDDYGFPRVLTETETNYFQMNGFWYNGGTESTLGNNPHIGPYDFGKSYFNKFECFVDDFNSYITGGSLVTVYENSFNNYNNGTFNFDQNGLPVPYYGVGYATALNTGGLVQNATVNSAGLTAVGGNNAPSYGRPSGDTYSMKINFTTGSGKTCTPPCLYSLSGGSDGIVYIIGNPTVPLQEQACCNNYWLPTQSTNISTCPPNSELSMSSETSLLGPCVVLYNGQSLSEQCCDSKTLGFPVSWDGKKCVDTNCLNATGGGGTVGTGTVIDSQLSAPKTLFRTAVGIGEPTPINNYVCYWCPPDSSVTTVCDATTYVNSLTDAQAVNLATNLGWTSTNTQSAKDYLIISLASIFNTYCFILDSNNKIISNEACCKLKGGNWIYNSTTNRNYCVVNNTNTCGDSTLNQYHIWVDSNGNTVSVECCLQLGHQYTNGTITVYTNGVLSGTIMDTVALGETKGNYCTDCPKTIDIVGGYVLNLQTGFDLSSKCCTDYGFIYNQTTGKCSQCPTNTINNSQSDGSTIILSESGTDLSEVCCDNVGGWYGTSNLYPTISKCYLCPPSSDAGYTFSTSNGTTELLYEGSSLTQACCTYYQTSMGPSSGLYWNPDLNKCLASSTTGGGTGGGTETVSNSLILGNIPKCFSSAYSPTPISDYCGAGVYNENTSCNAPFDCTLLPGVTNAIYTPLGQTPSTATALYINSSLTTLLTPATILSLPINSSFSSPGTDCSTGCNQNFLYFEYNNTLWQLDFNNNYVSGTGYSAVYTFNVNQPYPTPAAFCSPLGAFC